MNVRPKVTVISAGEVGEDVAQILAAPGDANVVTSLSELAGSHVVVTGEPDSEVIREIADRAPASIIFVTAGREVCQALLEATLFPAPRVVGIPGGPEAVAAAAGAAAFDRGSELDCLVAGANGYEPARARIGARGVREVV